jgi:anti-sigma factor RsiW
MTCNEYQQQISEFIDVELPHRDHRPLFQHLGTCEACWQYYRRIERIRGILQESTPAEVGAARTQRVHEPWARQRMIVNPASLLLNSVVAFLLGVLLTAALFRVDWTSPSNRNRESTLLGTHNAEYYPILREPLARPWRNLP